MTGRFEIRVLDAGDVAAYRALHRFGLEQAPRAFVETLANDAARPDSVVREMLARGDAWGLFDGDRLVGKLVIDGPPDDRLQHTRWLHAVYLHPDARGKGACDALMRTALADALARGATRVALWVNEDNAAARRMYERLGFVETGRVPGGIRAGETYVDDVLMCLSLAC